MTLAMSFRLTDSLRRGARFVRMLCVLSLAIASILHVVGDACANSAPAGSLSVSNAPDDGGTDAAASAEACHSCSVVSCFSAAAPQPAMETSSEVPEGSRVQISAVSLRIAGPPPKS